MAKTPRSRNADDKVIQGKELDAYIKAELQAMVQEGLEKSPIQPSTLHARLKAKGNEQKWRTGNAGHFAAGDYFYRVDHPHQYRWR
ncbi:hypothetical protein WJ951_002418 [Escherichia O88:H52]